MLNLTNREADQLARHMESAAMQCRELAREHGQRRDAMHLIGEPMMETFHATARDLAVAHAVMLEQDAADLRARRKPKTPTRAVPGPIYIAPPTRPDRVTGTRIAPIPPGVR